MASEGIEIQQNIKKGDNNNQAGRDINYYYNFNYKDSVILLEKIPKPNKDNIDRVQKEKEILEEIKSNNKVQVYGISGIGKTELIKSVVNKIDSYKKYWISCDDNCREIDLKNIPTLSGKSIDIQKKIENERLVVVLDNYNYKLTNICDEFSTVNNNNSKLIIISKEKSDYKDIRKIPIDYMTTEEAKHIFEHEEYYGTRLEKFLLKIDKHPMTLQIIKNYINPEEGIEFDDVLKELDEIVNMKDSEISSSQKICEKIVGVYYNNNKSLYTFLSLIDSNFIEAEFLKSVILSEIHSLLNKNFINYEKEYGYFYMHSLIIDSIKAVIKDDNNIDKFIEKYKDKIVRYLENKIEERDLKFYRFCSYNLKFVENFVERANDNYLKILLQNLYIAVNNYHDNTSVIEQISNVLENVNFDNYFEVKLLIEKFELEFSQLKSGDEKNQFANEKIQELKNIKVKCTSQKIQQLIECRIGKLYNWIGNYDAAITQLNYVIKNDDKCYSAILQLCRAYKNKAYSNKNKENEYVNKVYDILQKVEFSKMPMSIFLEIMSLIIYKPFNEKKILKVCLWDNFDLFSEYVKLFSGNKIFEHIYVIVGNLASNLYYTKKEFYKEWFKEFEHPNIIECNKKLLKAMINIYCYEVKRRQQATESIDDIIDSIEYYWKYYKEKYEIKHFEYKPIIDCYISIGDKSYADKAEEELNEIYDENNIWHLRYRSQINYIWEQYDEALKYIDLVLENCDSNFKEEYLDTFKKDKEKIVEIINKK